MDNSVGIYEMINDTELSYGGNSVGIFEMINDNEFSDTNNLVRLRNHEAITHSGWIFFYTVNTDTCLWNNKLSVGASSFK